MGISRLIFIVYIASNDITTIGIPPYELKSYINMQRNFHTAEHTFLAVFAPELIMLTSDYI